MTRSPIPPTLAGLLLGATAIALPLPAAAQQYPYQGSYQGSYYQGTYQGTYQRLDPPPLPDDIIVDAPRHRLPYRLPDDVESASQVVNYADLDLRYREDRAILRRRVDRTARDLCNRLGERDTGVSIVPSCREAAVRDAMRRVGTYDATYIPRESVLIEPHYIPYRTGWDR